jgi:uncharacterized protein YjiS (DUF1127 family)
MTSQRISFEHVVLPQPDQGSSWVRRVWEGLKRWREREAQRQMLARFDARMLEDIGITETEAWRETRLPFWLDA